MLPKVHKLETDFETVENVVKNMQDAGVEADAAIDALMLYKVRSVTHMFDKTKSTVLDEEWASQEKIDEELYKDLGRDLESADALARAQETNPRRFGNFLLSVDQCTDVASIAGAKGFKVGSKVFEKAFGSKQLYEVLEISNEVKIVEFVGVERGEVKKLVELKAFLNAFNVFKGELTMQIPNKDVNDHQIEDSDMMKIDDRKVELFSALKAYSLKQTFMLRELTDNLQFFVRPTCVIAARKIPQDIKKCYNSKTNIVFQMVVSSNVSYQVI